MQKDAIFKAKCLSLIDEARSFDAAAYAAEVRRRAEHALQVRAHAVDDQVKRHEGKPTHWTEVRPIVLSTFETQTIDDLSQTVSVDELYNIPASDYIDKRTGYPHPDDFEAQLVQKRAQHDAEYRNPHYKPPLKP